jgi:hypothetical protein
MVIFIGLGLVRHPGAAFVTDSSPGPVPDTGPMNRTGKNVHVFIVSNGLATQEAVFPVAVVPDYRKSVHLIKSETHGMICRNAICKISLTKSEFVTAPGTFHSIGRGHLDGHWLIGKGIQQRDRIVTAFQVVGNVTNSGPFFPHFLHDLINSGHFKATTAQDRHQGREVDILGIG